MTTPATTSAARPPIPSARRRPRPVRVVTHPGTVTAVAVLILWLVVAAAMQSTDLVPWPWELVRQITDDASLLADHGRSTLTVAGEGLVLGLVAVVPLAVIGLLFRPAEAVIMRLAVFIHVVPVVAIAPILVVSLTGDLGRIVITALQVYYPALVGVIYGLRQADRRALDVVHVAGGGNWQQLRRIRVEASVGGEVAGADAGKQSALVSAVTVAVTVVILIGGWQSLLSLFDAEPFFTKGPADVWQMMTSGNPGTGSTAGEFWSTFGDALGTTLLDAGVGFVVGSVVAVAAAVLLDSLPTLRRGVMPWAVVLRSVPMAALTPLLVLIFGRGLGGVTVIVTLVTFFPTLVTVLQGLQATPASAVDVVRASGGGAWQTVLRVKIIYAVPSMIAAARVAVPGALAGATLAEWLATGKGLGYMLTLSSTNADYLSLWTAGVLLAVVALGLHGVLGIIDRAVTHRLGA
jgi:ABC-type nitrate/sulfonate/bicarbonate transport system permease component